MFRDRSNNLSNNAYWINKLNPLTQTGSLYCKANAFLFLQFNTVQSGISVQSDLPVKSDIPVQSDIQDHATKWAGTHVTSLPVISRQL